jgi:hypothetical protein
MQGEAAEYIYKQLLQQNFKYMLVHEKEID